MSQLFYNEASYEKDIIVFNGHPVLGDLSFDFRKENGEPYKIILLVGENGCGKTTVLKEIYSYENGRLY